MLHFANSEAILFEVKSFVPTEAALKTQRVRDPLHNVIEFKTGNDDFEHALWQVVQSRPFQRLRRIKQLGFSDLVYPGASHSRLAHSLGVFETARRLAGVIRRHVDRPEDPKIEQALAAALVHDLGHGPFSHAFEYVGTRLNLKMANHELVSDSIIRDSEVSRALCARGSGFANDVADIIAGNGEKTIYTAIVSSQFDADRLDYMRRDRLMTGTQNAAIDFEWLLFNLQVASVSYGVDEQKLGDVQTFVLGPKALYAAEGYVLGLFQLYPTVYFHKATRGAEKIFVELLSAMFTLVLNGDVAATGLSATHPLIRFAREPERLELALCLDDTVVWGALSMMVDAPNPVLSGLAKRLRDRNLYKCLDVRPRLAEASKNKRFPPEETVNRIDAAWERIIASLAPFMAPGLERAPRIIADRAKRTPYRPIDESKGPLDRVNILTSAGALVDLRDVSQVVGALEPFTLMRLYFAADDSDARTEIEKAIAREEAA